MQNDWVGKKTQSKFLDIKPGFVKYELCDWIGGGVGGEINDFIHDFFQYIHSIG